MAVWSLFIILPVRLLLMSSITDESVLLTKGTVSFRKSFLSLLILIFKSGDKILSAYAHTVCTRRRNLINVLITALFAYPLSLKNLPGRKSGTFTYSSRCFSPVV